LKKIILKNSAQISKTRNQFSYYILRNIKA
jgi:hypothetical protein